MAHMRLESEFGLWLIVEVDGETSIVAPSCHGAGQEFHGDTDIWGWLPEFPEGDIVGQGLCEALRQNPWDWEARAVLSDYLVDAGREREAERVFALGEDWAFLASLRECVDGRIGPNTFVEIDCRECWGARYSAPGYMDCTDWELGDTEEEAVSLVREMYGEDGEDAE